MHDSGCNTLKTRVTPWLAKGEGRSILFSRESSGSDGRALLRQTCMAHSHHCTDRRTRENTILILNKMSIATKSSTVALLSLKFCTKSHIQTPGEENFWPEISDISLKERDIILLENFFLLINVSIGSFTITSTPESIPTCKSPLNYLLQSIWWKAEKLDGYAQLTSLSDWSDGRHSLDLIPGAEQLDHN